MGKAAKRIFVKARMTHTLEEAIAGIKQWKEIEIGGETLLRGATTFMPFERSARDNNEKTNSLKEYRLVVTKEARRGWANKPVHR